MRYIVTGGYGFIGSAVVRQLIGAGHQVFNLDKKTYAANPDAIAGLDVQNVRSGRARLCMYVYYIRPPDHVNIFISFI